MEKKEFLVCSFSFFLKTSKNKSKLILKRTFKPLILSELLPFF
jgi:hypothetical protein